MLKSVRNALFSSGSHEQAVRRFLLHGDDISWSFVKDAYERDLRRQARGDFRRCPKIKRETVDLNAFSKMRVPLAKHVLCYDRLRAEIKSYMQESKDQQPRATLTFLEVCDSIFGPFVRDEKVDSLDHVMFRRLEDGLCGGGRNLNHSHWLHWMRSKTTYRSCWENIYFRAPVGVISGKFLYNIFFLF
jgi:hypothetical protein